MYYRGAVKTVNRFQLLGNPIRYNLKNGLETEHLWEGNGVGEGIEIEEQFCDNRGEDQHMCLVP